MRILIITQDEPFYLAENIDYLIRNMPSRSAIVGCCLSDPSPFGKKEGLLKKALKTFRIFGSVFFIHYSLRYFINVYILNKQVKNVLVRHSVPIIELRHSINDLQSIDLLSSYKPDLLVSIAGNEIFKRPLIKLAPNGCLNLHTSLLPKYRGLMPSFWVLKNNENETGVSVFFVDEGIDSGQIIVQNRIEIGDRSQENLIRYTKQIGMDAIIKAINMIESGDYTLIPNNEAEMTYYSFPSREDVVSFLKAGKRFF